MVKKAEAQSTIEYLAARWADETGYVAKQGHYPSFSNFKSWLSANNWSHYLNFRSPTASYDAENWFEAALKNWWRRAD